MWRRHYRGPRAVVTPLAVGAQKSPSWPLRGRRPAAPGVVEARCGRRSSARWRARARWRPRRRPPDCRCRSMARVKASSREKPSSRSRRVRPGPRRAPAAAPQSTRRRPSAARGRDVRPCRRARTRSAPGRRTGAGAPCTTSATSASDCSVRGPSCSSSRNEAKSRRSRSWASASTAPSRFSLTSRARDLVACAASRGAGPRPASRPDRRARSSAAPAAPAGPPIDEVADRAGGLADDRRVGLGRRSRAPWRSASDSAGPGRWPRSCPAARPPIRRRR